MRELLLEVLGWLGYLERPAVLLQLAVVIGLMMLRRFAARRNWLRQLRPRAYTPLALVVLAASCLLLALLGLPLRTQRSAGRALAGLVRPQPAAAPAATPPRHGNGAAN